MAMACGLDGPGERVADGGRSRDRLNGDVTQRFGGHAFGKGRTQPDVTRTDAGASGSAHQFAGPHGFRHGLGMPQGMP